MLRRFAIAGRPEKPGPIDPLLAGAEVRHVGGLRTRCAGERKKTSGDYGRTNIEARMAELAGLKKVKAEGLGSADWL